MKKTIVVLLIVIVVVGGAAAIIQVSRQGRAAATDNYQTHQVEYGNLTETIGSTGQVRSSQMAMIPWQTSGRVDRVLVSLGEFVDAGQSLAVLADDSLAQNVIQAEAELLNAQQALDELMNSEIVQAQAYQAVVNARQAVIEAERLLATFDGDNYQNQVEQAENGIERAQEEIDRAENNLEPYLDRDEDDPTRETYQNRLDNAHLNYDEAVRQLELLLLQPEQAAANLETVRAQLAEVERRYEQVKDGPTTQEIATLEARIAIAEATLRQTSLTAPFAGVITEVKIKPGDLVTPGSLAFRLDDLSALLVDVAVAELDINRIQVGMPASLVFDAIPGEEFNARVTQVSPVGIALQGIVDYNVVLELTVPDERIKPGMTAAVNLVVDELEEVLLVPNRAVRARDGRLVVYLLENGELRSV
ncbi:MAG: efflux RND transporter periplasmic adaptor subunit, partial [Anaerolineales bacterium]|nr:efflux RND transporter periplasmic adaptor subunit [Anaerolineales bacterium]